MRVRCIQNDVEAFKNDPPRYEYLTSIIHGSVPLELGKTYVVYALALFQGQPACYLTDEDKLSYPAPYPSAFLEVIDGRFSPKWLLSPHGFGEGNLLLSFPEWASDPAFYERLVDGESDAQRVFDHYKALLDAES